MKVCKVLSAGALALAVGIVPLVSMAQMPQPYAGLETRPIKALSQEQIADLKAGRGMGFALAAELNGYPGPLHVLEHADALGLSEAQRTAVQTLFDAMKAEAMPLGEKLIAQEAELDRQFAGKTITDTSLDQATQAIGATQGALRATHLKYHLATIKVLSPSQVEHYGMLRGYAAHGAHSGPHHGGHRH